MKKQQADYPFIFSVLLLVVFGLIILSSASVVLSQDLTERSYFFLEHQLVYGILPGLLAFFICQKIHYSYWQKLAFPLMILSIILLSLVFVPQISYSHGGARRWIGLANFSFQPFEFVKLSFILYLSALLGKKGGDQKVIRESIKPFLVTLGIITGLVLLQPNMSALVILFVISFFLYFLAGLNFRYLFTMSALALAAFFVLIRISPYRMERLIVFLHPETDPQGIGYQINQALLAIGSGGLFGLGLGHSIQKWKYLPEVIGDSIFAVVAEELGLIGAAILVVLFVALAWRGLKIAGRAPDKLGHLLAGGITGWLFFQAFINMAVIVGLLPVTGLPLPFVSYGGSALVAVLAGAGIVVNISKYAR